MSVHYLHRPRRGGPVPFRPHHEPRGVVEDAPGVEAEEPVTVPVVEPIPDEPAVVVTPAVEAEVAPVEESPPETVADATVKWDMTMKKADLLALAVSKGVEIDESATKAQIIAALDATTTP